jgi:hypothetical protein
VNVRKNVCGAVNYYIDATLLVEIGLLVQPARVLLFWKLGARSC